MNTFPGWENADTEIVYHHILTDNKWAEFLEDTQRSYKSAIAKVEEEHYLHQFAATITKAVMNAALRHKGRKNAFELYRLVFRRSGYKVNWEQILQWHSEALAAPHFEPGVDL
jgi:hypothetical protein